MRTLTGQEIGSCAGGFFPIGVPTDKGTILIEVTEAQFTLLLDSYLAVLENAEALGIVLADICLDNMNEDLLGPMVFN